MESKKIKVEFQSTPPSLAETLRDIAEVLSITISIHSAIASGDHELGHALLHWRISIHSAIASGDTRQSMSSQKQNIFQSTPPSLAETHGKLPRIKA